MTQDKTKPDSLQAIKDAMTAIGCADACLLGREGVSEAMQFHREAIQSLQKALEGAA
jgi:hypothetical protein